MALFFSTHCKSSTPISHYNFHSLKNPFFSPLLVKAQVTHIQTKKTTKNFINHTTSDKIPSGYCLSGHYKKRVVKKSGSRNGREITVSPLVVQAQVSHIETKKTNDNFINHRTSKESSSGICLTGDDYERVVKKNGENGSRNGREIAVSPLVVRAQVSHIEAKTRRNRRTSENSSSGLCLSGDDNERVVKKSGENGSRNGRNIGYIENKTTNVATNEESSSGICLSGDENKRVVKKNGGNGRKFGYGVSSRSLKGEIFVKKTDIESARTGVGLVIGSNVEKGSRKRRELGSGDSTRSSESVVFVKKLIDGIGENGSRKRREFGSGDSTKSSKGEVFVKKVNKEMAENDAGFVVERNSEKGSRKRREIGSGVSPDPKGEIFVKKPKNGIGNKTKKGVDKEKVRKGDKDNRVQSPALIVRVGLDMCSKKGDAMEALKLYDKALIEGVHLGQYHYTVLLYLCSSAAIGVVSPAKSGKDSRSLGNSEASSLSSIGLNENAGICNGDNGNMEPNNQLAKDQKPMALDKVGDVNGQGINRTILLNDDFRKYALKRGFEIYERMCLEKITMNEASLTSIARMALAMGDGDMAFDTINQMKELGINPRLRSYGPALTAFCNSGNIDKAFLVEEHMVKHGVYPEEPEFEALLRVSVEGNRSDKVYYLLHKLRSSVRQVSASTADLLEKWFKCDEASEIGKKKWDEREIRTGIERGGGGWHGQGWLGEGKWNVSRTYVGDDGFCKCCGEKLATIDLDPEETEKFAESVASIAAKREKSSFQKFQKWLDYYGPFEAVVDAANIGLYTQRKFKPSKVNAVVNGIRHMLPSKRWPLIVLHNRRVSDDNMDKPMNKAIVEKWKNADALYATPTGSNDDWYWLYAAIKFKCLLVTNDEMRDHLFQLLGNDFFPRWKERHQVHFSFSETGPLFYMPPPCSVVIQESEKGHWHIPMASEHEFTQERNWLCVTRDKSVEKLESATIPEGDNEAIKSVQQDNYRNSRISSTPTISSTCSTILQDIEAAEKLGTCVINFEI